MIKKEEFIEWFDDNIKEIEPKQIKQNLEIKELIERYENEIEKEPKHTLVLVDEALNELHNEIISKHPKMTKEQFKGLVLSILERGYDKTEPILIWRGKIVDGRHRLLACKILGIKLIPFKELPYKWSKKQVLEATMGKNINRRHLSKSQLACMAFLDYMNDKNEEASMIEYASKYGVDKTLLSKLNTIMRYLGIEPIENIAKFGSTKIDGKYISNITTLYKKALSIRDERAKSKKVIEYEYNTDRAKKIKDEYFKLVEENEEEALMLLKELKRIILKEI